MRFMIIRKADEETEAGMKPSEELLEAMAAYNEELVNAGVMVVGEGLKPTAQAARVSFSGGTPTVIDGPFTETKELIAGYSILECASLQEAIEWTKKWPVLDGHGNVQLEIRPVYTLADFGDSEGVQHHARLQEQMANR